MDLSNVWGILIDKIGLQQSLNSLADYLSQKDCAKYRSETKRIPI